MRLLLGSGGFRTEERIQLLAERMRGFFGPIRRLLFVPYALGDHDGYVRLMIERGLHAGYELDGLHHHSDPAAALGSAEGLFIGGGNTFRLLTELNRRGLLAAIRTRVRDGLPYLGISAGANIACPTIKTTNDMPIIQPPSLDALDLVPFQINAHYYEGRTFLPAGDSFQEHFGETRDERLREFHELNETTVIGLWEGGVLDIEDGRIVLRGARARVFRKGRQPVDVEPGGRIDTLLEECPPPAPERRTPAAIAYTVAVTFADARLVEPWLHWLRDGHLAEVLAGGASHAEVVARDGPTPAFEVRYRFPSREVFEHYEHTHAPRLRAEGLRLFPESSGVCYQRSVGVVSATLPRES